MSSTLARYLLFRRASSNVRCLLLALGVILGCVFVGPSQSGAAPGTAAWFSQSMTWRSIGPFRGGRVVAVSGVASDPQTYYFGGVGGGIYKSSNAGKTWVHLGLESTRVISRIRINPTNPELVYIAAQGTPYIPSNDRGVYRSQDGGKTWEKILFVNDVTGPSDLA